MSDIREALVAHLERVGMGYGLHDGLKREVLGAWADAILSKFDVTPKFTSESTLGQIAAALAHHDAELRAEVERLRGVERGWQHDRAEWERERDEARQQLADLRAGIERIRDALTAHIVEYGPMIDAEAPEADLTRLLAGSGEQPGEVAHACPAGDEGLTPCCGRTPFELPSTDRMTLDAELVTCHRPAPVAPDKPVPARDEEAPDAR